jgi:hypothetical protein
VPHNHDLLQIANQIINAAGEPTLFELSLSDFKKLYRIICEKAHAPTVDVVLNGNTAAIQFTGLCNHRILVVPDQPSNLLGRLQGKNILEEKDFDSDLAPKFRFYGQRKRIALLEFLAEEIATNGWLMLLVGLICVTALAFLGNKEVYVVLNEALITSATLFVTIFLLFAVSQNSAIIKDLSSFKTGVMHRWFAIDSYIAQLAIFSLCVSIAARTLTEVTLTQIRLGNTILVISNLSWVIISLTCLSLVTLVDCFVAITNYYFKRIQMIVYRDLTQDILDDAISSQDSTNDSQEVQR